MHRAKITPWTSQAQLSPKTPNYQKSTPNLAATNDRRSRLATCQQTPKAWRSSATTLTHPGAMDFIIGQFGIYQPKLPKLLADHYPWMPSRGLPVGVVLAGTGRSHRLARTAINFTCTRWIQHWTCPPALNPKNSSLPSRRTSLAKLCWPGNLVCLIFFDGARDLIVLEVIY